MKSDNINKIGTHAFEAAGLGKAPFQLIRVDYRRSGCAYCGTGIVWCLTIKSADGRTFIVGNDCANKIGDAGIIKAFKTSPEYRSKQRDARKRADDRVKEEWGSLTADPGAREKLAAHTVPDWRGNPEPWLQMAERVWPMCGASGRRRYLKAAKQIIAGQL